MIHLVSMFRTGHHAIAAFIANGRHIADPVDPAIYMAGIEGEIALWPDQTPESVESWIPCDDEVMIVLRDPENLFASRIRAADAGISPPVDWPYDLILNNSRTSRSLTADIWQTQYDWAIAHPKQTIVFPLWHADESYSRSIASGLGIPFNAGARDRVAHDGGGSSFDGLAYDGRARQQPVNDRWRLMQHDIRWQQMVSMVRVHDRSIFETWS